MIVPIPAFIFWSIGMFTMGMLIQLAVLAWADARIRRRHNLVTDDQVNAALHQYENGGAS